MIHQHRTWALCLLVGATGVGCTSEVREERANLGSGGAGGGAVVTTTASNGGAGATQSYCEEVCAPLSDNSCLDTQSCLAECTAGAPGWSEPAREAFAACAAEDPLCFISVEGCMLGQLRETSAARFALDGAGFEAYEGAQVHIAIERSRDTTVVSNGSFQRSYDGLQAWDTNGPFVLLFIDGDGDGLCTPGSTDFHIAESLVWNGSFDDIAYELEVSPNAQRKDFVCSNF